MKISILQKICDTFIFNVVFLIFLGKGLEKISFSRIFSPKSSILANFTLCENIVTQTFYHVHGEQSYQVVFTSGYPPVCSFSNSADGHLLSLLTVSFLRPSTFLISHNFSRWSPVITDSMHRDPPPLSIILMSAGSTMASFTFFLQKLVACFFPSLNLSTVSNTTAMAMQPAGLSL